MCFPGLPFVVPAAAGAERHLVSCPSLPLMTSRIPAAAIISAMSSMASPPFFRTLRSACMVPRLSKERVKKVPCSFKFSGDYSPSQAFISTMSRAT